MSAPERPPTDAASPTPGRSARSARHHGSGHARGSQSPAEDPATGRGLRLVGYVRVSTDKQAERYGPDSQRADIEAWAKRHGHRVVEWTSDAVSGVYERLADRVGWVDALAALDSKRVDAIAIPRLDRLSRDTIAQELLLRDADWRVYSALDGENDYMRNDPDDPTRKLVRTIFGAIATYDRDMTVLKLKRARRAKAAKGGHAQGKTPYGYKASPNAPELAPDPAQQRALARMRELRATDPPHSTREIADALNAEGHPTKYGGQWHTGTVARILARKQEATK